MCTKECWTSLSVHSMWARHGTKCVWTSYFNISSGALSRPGSLIHSRATQQLCSVTKRLKWKKKWHFIFTDTYIILYFHLVFCFCYYLGEPEYVVHEGIRRAYYIYNTYMYKCYVCVYLRTYSVCVCRITLNVYKCTVHVFRQIIKWVVLSYDDWGAGEGEGMDLMDISIIFYLHIWCVRPILEIAQLFYSPVHTHHRTHKQTQRHTPAEQSDKTNQVFGLGKRFSKLDYLNGKTLRNSIT